MMPDPDMRERATRDVEEMSVLLDDALTFARTSFAGNRSEQVDLAEIVCRECSERAAAGQSVKCNVSATPIQVWGDPAALARIVGNLIDNAVKYGGEAVVTLSQAGTQAGAQAGTQAGTEAVMLVDDRGPGVPSAERERIFEPFLRLEASRIAIAAVPGRSCHRAASGSEPGGTITMEDRPGGGAFRVMLPARQWTLWPPDFYRNLHCIAQRACPSIAKVLGGATMKRRHFLQAAGIAAAATAVAKPAIAQPTPELRWRLTSSFPKSLDTIYTAAEIFSKAVAEATDNKFQIQVFAAGEIVPAIAAADAVQNGTVEMCHTSSYYYFGKDPTFAFGTAVPFGLNTRMQNAWMYHGGGMELMNDFYKKFNIIGFPAGNTGAPDGWWFRRRSRMWLTCAVSKCGSAGFALAPSSPKSAWCRSSSSAAIHTALERGTIDAAEWVGPYDDARSASKRLRPTLLSGLVGRRTHDPQFRQPDKWNSLSPAYRSLVRTASSLANEWMVAKYDAVNRRRSRRCWRKASCNSGNSRRR
jgi:TRAP-type mannitol/chloroaromatic compound transport system substrate-binding protein